jgi:hypothetical protein
MTYTRGNDMADTQETRRRNLRRLVSEHGGMNKLAARLGLSKGAYISQLLTDPPVRTISEKTCRKFEVALGLSTGWMDGQPRPYGTGKAPALDTALLAQTIAAVTDVLKLAGVTLPPARFADLVALQYEDALPTGRVDKGRIGAIVGLLK